MKTFLESVAEDIYQKAEGEWQTSMADLVVVFPNKRAALFLDDRLASLAQRPVWSPTYCSISELFSRLSPLQVADPLLLVSRLWRVYTRVTGIDETLDEFFGWGQMLLSDFDDVDSQQADADHLFANLRDLHELDDVSFLSPEQIKALREFFVHLSEDPVSQLRQRFLRVWSRLGDVYREFREDLRRDGLAYQGMLCRDVVECALPEDGKTYVFVGFNALRGVEHELFRQLKREGRAHFYWDYDRYYLPSSPPVKGFEANEAGLFVAEWLEEFPNELGADRDDLFDCFSKQKDLTFVSAQTEDIQGRYVSQWLQSSPSRLSDGRQTAVVMCNEQLLSTVLHQLSFSEERLSVNVTTGIPLSSMAVASLVQALLDLRTVGYRGPAQQPERQYRWRWLKAVLNHPYIAPVAETDDARALLLSMPDPLSPTLLARHTALWVAQVLALVAPHLGQDPLARESVFRAYTLMQRLYALMDRGDLPIDLHTLSRLMQQLTAFTTIPLHGEPAEGLQVMGMLETRCLDFTHILLLSASEGQLPRGVSDQSFIPYALRKAYGLSTPEHRVAVYSYHFHRLLQRATDVTICFNAATNDTAKGEMSRYLTQLLVEDRHHRPRLLSLQPALGFTPFRPLPREKTADTMATLHERFSTLLSPTALGRYLRCPLLFYFNYVRGISEPEDDVDEGDMNLRDFGNVFHEAAQMLYQPFVGTGRMVTASAMDGLLKDESLAERLVDQAFDKVMDRQNGPYSGLQVISREVIIHLLRRLMEVDRRLAPFQMVALEEEATRPVHIRTNGFSLDTMIGGRIDRLDLVGGEGGPCLRVVDYKTGAAQLKGLPDVAAVFDPAQLKNHNQYYLQAMLYADIVADKAWGRAEDEKTSPTEGPTPLPKAPVAPALLFIQHAAAKDYSPLLVVEKQTVADMRSLHEEFNRHLEQLVNHIFSADEPFLPTPHTERCVDCAFRTLCGKENT